MNSYLFSSQGRLRSMADHHLPHFNIFTIRKRSKPLIFSLFQFFRLSPPHFPKIPSITGLSLLFTLFLVSLYLPEVSEACLPPSHLGLTTPTEDTRRAAPRPPSAASTPALEILPAPSPGSPKGFHGVNVTTSVARKWEKKTTDHRRILKLQFGSPLGLLSTIWACFRPIFTLLHYLCIKAVGCAQK